MPMPKDVKIAGALLTTSLCLSALLSAYPLRCFVFLGWYGWTVCTHAWFPWQMARSYPFQQWTRLYFLSFLCVGTYALMQPWIPDPFLTQWITPSIGRPNAFAYEPSFYALYMTPFVMIVTLRRLLFREVSWGLVAWVSAAFLISTSTSTLFAYGICAFMVLLFQPLYKSGRSGRLWLFLTAGFTGIGALFPSLSRQFFFKFFTLQGWMHTSFLTRAIGIKNAWLIFKERPFFGVGLGAYPLALYEKWKQGDPRYTIPAEGELFDLANPVKIFEPTNVATEVLASLGLLGAVACLLAVGLYLRYALRALRRPQADPEEKRWVFLFMIATLTMLCVLQFNQGTLRTYVWSHAFLTLGFFSRCLSSSSVSCATSSEPSWRASPTRF